MRTDIYQESVATWTERNMPEKPVSIKDTRTGERLTVSDNKVIGPAALKPTNTMAE
ncbi:hypothetical protein HWV62_27663 [Athelia sp. TMB]|nr:hypothetical protein HWV62_27663 [Athelia sp. TMB]